MKKRIDIVLVEKNLVETRNKAQQKIKSGKISVDGKIVAKSSELVDLDANIIVNQDELDFVSRAGVKLNYAIDFFKIDLQNKIAVDIGASTGGFTDCMLQRGIKKVYAIDVGQDQLSDKLKNDPRVVNIEQMNFRYIDKNIFKDKIDFVSIDVSFISLEKILSIVSEIFESIEIVALIKPQFEVGKKFVGKNGIVKDPKIRKSAVEKIQIFARNLHFNIVGTIESPITGTDGNIEYLINLRRC